MRRGIRWLAVALVLGAACAACTGGRQPASNEDKSTQALAGALSQARAANVDQSQLDVLSGAAVTFDQYQGAIDRALDCMRSAGLQIVSTDVTRYSGQDIVSYTVAAGSVPQDQVESVQGTCYQRYARYVDEFWQTSTPDELAYDERRSAALLGPLTTCLKGYGADVPADASFHDLLVLADQHSRAQGGHEDCLTDIGYSTWEG